MNIEKKNVKFVRVNFIYILLQLFPLLIMISLIYLTWNSKKDFLTPFILFIVLSPFIWMEMVNIYRMFYIKRYQYSDHFLLNHKTGEKLLWQDILYYEKRLYGVKLYFKNEQRLFISKSVNDYPEILDLIMTGEPEEKTVILGFQVK